MQPNTYPDGFPQTSLEAIEFSYFLTPEEKEDWKQWLNTATAEQQFELVDTLHAMWQENQKSAIPDGFNTNPQQTTAATQNTTTQYSQPTPQPPTENSAPATMPTSEESTIKGTDLVQEQPKTKELETTTPSESQEIEKNNNNQKNNSQQQFSSDTPRRSQNDQNNRQQQPRRQNNNANGKSRNQNTNSADNAAIAFGNQAYTPNPLIDDAENTDSVDIDHFADKKETDVTNQSQTESVKKQVNQNHKPYFNVTKLRESATKQELEKLYTDYTRLRESNFTSAHEFYEAQGKMLDKIMAVVVNFEQVADFFDSLSQKLIEINDKLVNQVKDYNYIKGSISAQQGDIVDQLEHLRNDVDRLFRITREDKSDSRRQFEDIKTELAVLGADSYGSGDGVLQRIDLLSSQLHKLELDFKRSNISEQDKSLSSLRENKVNAPTKVNVSVKSE